MCKTRFDSHGMILNVFFLKNHFSKYINGTRDPPSLQMPFQISILVFGTLPLKLLTRSQCLCLCLCLYLYEHFLPVFSCVSKAKMNNLDLIGDKLKGNYF